MNHLSILRKHFLFNQYVINTQQSWCKLQTHLIPFWATEVSKIYEYMPVLRESYLVLILIDYIGK